jgi:phage terminase large subunit
MYHEARQTNTSGRFTDLGKGQEEKVPFTRTGKKPKSFQRVTSGKHLGFVRSGIDKLKSVQIMVHQDSVNIIRELRNYAWKRDYKTNAVTNQPEDDNNHALDALRYVAMEKLKANAGKYTIR